MVLRVSAMRVGEPAGSASTKRRVRVAVPLRRCVRLRAVRSAASSERALPSTRQSTAPRSTSVPSATSCSTRRNADMGAADDLEGAVAFAERALAGGADADEREQAMALMGKAMLWLDRRSQPG